MKGQCYGVTWAGINFANFRFYLILHLKDHSGEKGAFANVINDDSLHFHTKPDENITDQVVSDGTFALNIVDDHRDGVTYL